GIVLEDADAPVVGPEAPANLLRCSKDGLLEQIVDAAALEIDPPLECLVRAMFRPSLCHCFQLDIGRIAAQLAKMSLNGPHFGEVERQLPVLADARETGIIQVTQGHADQPERVRGAKAQISARNIRVYDPLYRIIAEHLAKHHFHVERRPAPIIAPECKDRVHRNADIASSAKYTDGNRIHYTGFEQHRCWPAAFDLLP